MSKTIAVCNKKGGVAKTMFWIADRTISGCYKKQNNREQLSVKA